MSKISKSSMACFSRIRQILSRSRSQALQSVNTAMITAYWHIGREIVEEEQRGRGRADCGSALIEDLSMRLRSEFGRSFSEANLRLIRQFYLTYQNRSPQIRY
jgi:hypothetical protein